MPLKFKFWARSACLLSAVLALILFGFGRVVSASGQTPAPPQTGVPAVPPVGASSASQTGPVTRLSADEAVRMALENNLGIQAERLGPQINTFTVAQARAAYAPVLFSNFFNRSSTQPPSSFVTGTATNILTTETISQDGGLAQNVPWGGGNYSLSLNGGKVTTSAIDSRYNPQLSSNLSARYVQPLLRNFKIDAFRQQIMTSQNNQVIADIDLRQQVTVTSQAVRNAYFDLIGAIEGHKVAVQSLELAQDQLKSNRTKVEVGTLAPIDIIEA
jgi:outer membrane protein